MKTLAKVYPPTWLLLAIILIVLMRFLVPGACLLRWPLHLLGLPLAIGGLAIACWASWLFQRAETGIRPDHQPSVLVATGPYRFSRNPMYLGFVALLLGLAVGLGNVLSFVVVAAYAVLMDRCFIRPEETQMQRAFRQGYAVYKARVRRWI